MKKSPFLLCLLFAGLNVIAQKPKKVNAINAKTILNSEIKIPFKPERWEFKSGFVEFIEHKGVSAMKVLPEAGQVVLKDFEFEDGTIEFDIEPQVAAFTGIYFRRQDSREAELFYLRMNKASNPLAIDIAQYVGIIKGVNMWDLLPHYQNAASVRMNDWNHIKLIISGVQMLVYVNNMSQPTLEIPKLEGDVTKGNLAFDGGSIFANLVVKPNQVEDLASRVGFDPTNHDTRYIRNWQVSQPNPLPPGQEVYAEGLAKLDTIKWHNITVERRGLINLTRRYGQGDVRRVAYLKVKLNSKTAQKKLLKLGFLNEVWVFVNKKTVFVDKNLFPQNMRKIPDGRISIENASFQISLEAGINELIIGIASNFFGWGIIAQLDSMEGITIE